MLTVKEAIAKRRSIRRFRPDPVSDETVRELIDAARLAPSGCNAQPWRFKIVRDSGAKEKLAHAAHGQQFVARAPVVLVCCADIRGYLDGSASAVQDLGRSGAVQGRIVQVLSDRIKRMRALPPESIAAAAAINVAIAVEHIVLRALDFGLGSCWVKLFDEKAVKETFGWGDDLHVVCLLSLGYPAEEPPPRGRLVIEEILID
jgi:nitroreductase